MRTGLEKLIDEGPPAAGLARGARVGLLAHPASVDREGRNAADLLTRHGSLRLVRLFAPEHGVRGEAQDMEAVEPSADPFTGLPVRSLYGGDEASLRPRPGDLEGLDAVICDLQDVGSRYYTFVYTIAHVMEAAAEAGIPVAVLDRPNPIGGIDLEGPVLEPAMASFVGRYPLPVRHGMTVAELTRMCNEQFGIGCDLRTVPMEGWRREMHFEDTSLPWVPPSPNIPCPGTALVYPGGCLIEGTNLSEGRGTTRPFETLGAPWLDGARLREAMEDSGLPGALFRETIFRPTFHKHRGEDCGGLFVHVTDRKRFRPFATYLEILAEARRQDPGAFAWRTETYEFVSDRLAIDLLLGRDDLRSLLVRGVPAREMEAAWKDDLEAFGRRRERFLMYGP